MSRTELAIVLAAVVIGAIAKAITGMGLALIAIQIGTRLRNSVSVSGFDLAIVGMLRISAIALLLQTFFQ